MLNYHTPKRDFFSVLPCRRDGEVEKKPFLMVKKDGMILEKNKKHNIIMNDFKDIKVAQGTEPCDYCQPQ